MLPVRGNREAIAIEITINSGVVGVKLDQIDLPPETYIVAIVGRDGSLKSLAGDTIIQAHDEVVAVTVGEQAEALLEVLSTEG